MKFEVYKEDKEHCPKCAGTNWSYGMLAFVKYCQDCYTVWGKTKYGAGIVIDQITHYEREEV